MSIHNRKPEADVPTPAGGSSSKKRLSWSALLLLNRATKTQSERSMAEEKTPSERVIITPDVMMTRRHRSGTS